MYTSYQGIIYRRRGAIYGWRSTDRNYHLKAKDHDNCQWGVNRGSMTRKMVARFSCGVCLKVISLCLYEMRQDILIRNIEIVLFETMFNQVFDIMVLHIKSFNYECLKKFVNINII